MSEQRRRRERVASDERRKAAFIAEYKDMCVRHCMMAGIGGGGDLPSHIVVDFSSVEPEQFERQLQEATIEMVVGDLVYAVVFE